ncbi:MAG: alpha/beta fold hydrolase [Hyphomicrobiaceae bacterium]
MSRSTALRQLTVPARVGQALRPALFNAVPRLAGYLAFLAFCTPAISRHRSPDHVDLVRRARFHLRLARSETITTRAGEVVTHIVEPLDGPPKASVLVVHGWTSEASFMMAIAEFLRRRRYRVVLPDLPAHGLSPGVRTSLIDCAHAVREVAEATGPIRLVVAHSMGGLAALLAGGGGPPMPTPYPFEAYALIAIPNRFQDVTRAFGREQGISLPAQVEFEHRLEKIAFRRIEDFTGVSLLNATGRPALIVHARDDEEVAFADAETIAGACPTAALEAFDGFGHRKILYAPPVARSIGAFLDRELGGRTG